MEIKIRDEFIKLGQALKLAGVVEDGVEAKYAIQDGLVQVNGEVDQRRGRKVYEGDVITFEDQYQDPVGSFRRAHRQRLRLPIIRICSWILIKEPIFFMEIMRRVKPIFWNLCIFVGQRNHIKEAKTKKSFVLERKNLIFE